MNTKQSMLLITDSELSEVLTETLRDIGKDELIALLKSKPVPPKKRGRPAGKTKNRDFQIYVFWCFIRSFYKVESKGAVMASKQFIAERVFYLDVSRVGKIIRAQDKEVCRILADMKVNQQAIESGSWAINFLMLLAGLQGKEALQRYMKSVEAAKGQLVALGTK